MISQQVNDVERKTVAILKVLSDSPTPLGGRVLARKLKDMGIDLGERAVRYHLKLLDERGLTQPVGRKDGRLITKSGIEEIHNALVADRVGLMTTKICTLSYRSSFDIEKRTGDVPINVSLFSKDVFERAVKLMMNAFKKGIGFSSLVAIAPEEERLGQIIIPEGKIGLATVSQIVVCSVLLKAGIMPDARFGGVLELRNYEPRRFVDLIEYTGSSLDPSEIFISSKLTTIERVIKGGGNGKVLASFWEIPASARLKAEVIIDELSKVGMNGIYTLGKSNQPIYELPVAMDKAGIVLSDSLNPVAAAVEAGIKVTNHTMSGAIDFGELRNILEYKPARF
jgi:repressor of nif and glnA expression